MASLSSAPSSASGLPQVVFVTGNANKLKEVTAILNASSSSLPFELVARKIDLPELQGSLSEIARDKVKIAAKTIIAESGKSDDNVKGVMVEDTALCFDALGNDLPGPYIKWFLESLGHDGLNKMLVGFAPNNKAKAVCTFAYVSTDAPSEEPAVFVGETHGAIVPARGDNKFGWDPIFEPNEGNGLTYAQMSSEAKNAISHRYRALDKLRGHLLNLFQK
ncbi:inosine triphosphate pyrophosphatase [Pseudoscourfieldia marina]